MEPALLKGQGNWLIYDSCAGDQTVFDPRRGVYDFIRHSQPGRAQSFCGSRLVGGAFASSGRASACEMWGSMVVHRSAEQIAAQEFTQIAR